VEEEFMSREHEVESVMVRIIINADYDDNDPSESSVSCDDDDDLQGTRPLSSDSE
jgi:hypothetical protein